MEEGQNIPTNDIGPYSKSKGTRTLPKHERHIIIMTQDTHVNRKKNQPTKGKTDYTRLKNMTEAEIEENAKNDPDAPLVADEDMEKFKHVKPKD